MSLSGNQEPLQEFFAAHQRYVRGLQAALRPEDVGEKVADAYRDYLQVLQPSELPLDLQEKAKGAFEDLTRAWQGQGSGAGGATGAEDAYGEYAAVIREASEQHQERVATAYRLFLDAIREAPVAVWEGATGAFASYCGELKAAWTGLDADSVDAQGLTAISQSMSAAASLHGATMWALGQAMTAASAMPRDYTTDGGDTDGGDKAPPDDAPPDSKATKRSA